MADTLGFTMARPSDSGLTVEQAKALSDKLREHEARYKNQTEMAKALDIAQPQLSQILRAGPKARGAGIAVLVRIRNRLGVSLDELLGLPSLGPPLDVLLRREFDRLASEREARNGNKPPSSPSPESPPPPSPRRRS